MTERLIDTYGVEPDRHAHAFSSWRAIVYPGGPPLTVIGGVGAGKTAMLAQRAAALILGGADPKRMMLVTFSRQAAAEVNRRIEWLVAQRLSPEAAAGVAIPFWSGAFHAIGAAARVSLMKPRRRRRLSFHQAEKLSGHPVASVTDHPDGSRTYAFGQTTASSAEVNEWDLDLGTNPSPLRQ